MKNRPIAKEKVYRIAAHIIKDIDSGALKSLQDLGLYSGAFGIILFLCYYLHLHPNQKFTSIFEKYLETSIERLTKEPLPYSYCNGLSGILDCLQLLKGNSLLNIDYTGVNSSCSEMLLSIMKQNITHHNYDFMHGGLGISFCYLHSEYFIGNTIDALKISATQNGALFKWKSYIHSMKCYGYDLSLSHGMSSVIIFLAKAFKMGIQTEEVKPLLIGASQYVMQQELDREKYNICFPTLILEGRFILPKSKLAWCHGDLGVAVALWQAGEVLEDINLCSKALEVFRFCAHKRDSNDKYSYDAGICHGSAGIALVFKYIYQKTNEHLFFNAYEYWLHITLILGCKDRGICGYSRFYSSNDEDNEKLRNDYELLEGVSGIGLMLLSKNAGAMPISWSKLLLLY